MNNGTPQTSTSVLCWPKRLLSADDLRRHLTSQRELLLLPKTIITPLAVDELRAKGVRISWQVPQAKEVTPPAQGTWSYAQEKPDALVASAIKALERDGITLTPLDVSEASTAWARTIAETILRTGQRGAIVFCAEPSLLSCLANKISGLRAASIYHAGQIARIHKLLSPNLFAIEMPGRTFFEVRQMLRSIVTTDGQCPQEMAKTLQELDGHAHR